MKSADDVELSQLIRLFFDEQDFENSLGRFTECQAEELPLSYRELLAHEHHMTVTVEAHHHSQVDLQVLATQQNEKFYSRKIVLRRQSDGMPVLFGIVRIDLSILSPDVRQQIEHEKTPLGRVLISQGVLRRVKLVGFYRVRAGKELVDLFSDPHEVSEKSKSNTHSGAANSAIPKVLYGRTALIFCDERPVIELLEIVQE